MTILTTIYARTLGMTWRAIKSEYAELAQLSSQLDYPMRRRCGYYNVGCMPSCVLHSSPLFIFGVSVQRQARRRRRWQQVSAKNKTRRKNKLTDTQATDDPVASCPRDSSDRASDQKLVQTFQLKLSYLSHKIGFCSNFRGNISRDIS